MFKAKHGKLKGLGLSTRSSCPAAPLDPPEVALPSCARGPGRLRDPGQYTDFPRAAARQNASPPSGRCAPKATF